MATTTRTAKNPTPHNDTPNTPDVRESAIAKMKVDELRRKLRGHGVKDTAELKKPELVKQLIKAEVSATKKTSPAKSKPAKSTATKSSTTKSSPAKSSTTKSSTTKSSTAKSSPAKSAAAKSSTAKSTAAKSTTKATKSTSKATRSTSKNPTSHNDTPNTPDVSETAIAEMKADALRRKLRGHGVKGTAELKKPELIKQLTKIEVRNAKKPAKKKVGAGKAKG